MKHHVVQLVAAVSAAIALAITAAATAATSSRGAAATLPPGNTVEQWDKIAEDTVVGSGAFQNEGLLYMAYTTGAMYDAAVSIQGGYKPLLPPFRASKKASVDAAVATAAYLTLSNYFPAASGTLDPLYAEALGAIADGPAKLAGEKVGRVAADHMIRARTGDGRQMPIASTSTFSTLTPGPGVWRLTPSAFAAPQTPWLGNVRPFILKSGSQFLPPPPPSLSSQTWVDSFNEIKMYGAATGSLRSADQTATALFWTANVIRQYNRLVRDITDSRGLDLVQTARLAAMVNVVGEDAGISVMYAKYHYLWWRPVTAIDPSSVGNDGFGPVPGFNDGNAATAEQPGWRPLIATPNHPEYPSAHTGLSSAVGEVIQQFLGTAQINVDVHGFDASGVAGNLNAVKHFATTADWRTDVANARVWGGLHYRFSVQAGNDLGLNVATYDLAHAFQATS